VVSPKPPPNPAAAHLLPRGVALVVSVCFPHPRRRANAPGASGLPAAAPGSGTVIASMSSSSPINGTAVPTRLLM